MPRAPLLGPIDVPRPVEEPTADPFPQAAAARRDLLEYLDAGWNVKTPAQQPVPADSTGRSASPSAEVGATPAKPRRAATGPERPKTLGQIRRQEAIDRAREYLSPRPGQQKEWAEETEEGEADGQAE